MAPAFAVTDDLSWTVSKRPLFFRRANGSTAEWPDKVAIVRDDNERALGSVSPNYEIVQNSDLLNLVNPMIEEGLLTIKNVGYLAHGAQVFAQAKVNQEFQVIGESYESYITILNGHTGNASVAIGSTATRVICGNTFAMAYSDISERYRHSTGVNERVLETTAILDYVNGAMKKYSEYVETLASTKCTQTQFKTALEAIYNKPTDKMRTSFVQKLNDLFYSGKGNEGKTLYDALNSVTEYASNYSRKSVNGRFQYANFGQGANINRRAMAVLTEMAAV